MNLQGGNVKICVTSEGHDLDSKVDPRFGRCSYFIFVDTDTGKYETVKNPNLEETGGVGIRSGKLVVEKGVEAVISGNIGPNAFQALSAAKVKTYTVSSGTIREVVEKFKRGEFEESNSPTVNPRFNPER